ncbi:ATP-grasp domain-containing protein [Collinsella sp. AGMB00827]|uniref:ATP-grasp domain-containing protein n=1 Tax=Collinsella ureilytica TaxID=2869515 RepID=A0ABS7MI18_9ACTN|nr:ATP-grasp domain-containing protein [Collinsella urealyticum]MBY4796995.1 ATP-grasp domain-containing protein [Collinsella urealyticum]
MQLSIPEGRRLAILGSMDEFCDLVELARSYGIYTVVVDGYDDGPAKQLADRSYLIDPRDTAAIAAMCGEERVDAIFGTFSDLLAECMVDISAKAGLPCYATPERFSSLREKPLMKRMFDELGIAHAHSCVLSSGFQDEDLADVGFPCVVKPSNGYGSRGVYIAHDVAFIREHFDEIASYSIGDDRIIAEAYNNGYEMNMMSWIVDGKAVILSIADREKTQLNEHDIPYVSRIVYPGFFTAELAHEAQKIVQAIAEYVGIETGPLCVQLFYTPGAGIQVCEAAGRIFGYEHELLELAGGLRIEELILAHLFDHDALRRMLSGHDCTLSSVAAGLYFHGWEGREVADLSPAVAAAKTPGVSAFLPYYEIGDTVAHGVGAKPYVCRYYLQAPYRLEVDSLTADLFERVHVLDQAGKDLLYHNQMSDYPENKA